MSLLSKGRFCLNKSRFLVGFGTKKRMESCVSLPLPSGQLKELIDHAKDYVASHGLVVRTKEEPEVAEKVTHVSFMLLPSPVPSACFNEACAVQTHFNSLIHKVAHDYEFLRDCLKSTIKVDAFTGQLWSIYETLREEGITQPITLGLLRSDYMLDSGIPSAQIISDQRKVDAENIQIKQIEINTIASSFGGLSSQLYPYHRFALHHLEIYDQDNKIPKNEAAVGLAEGFVSAWNQYGNTEAAILFVVQKNERNIYDQRWVEYAIHQLNPKIKVIRRNIEELGNTARITDNKKLMVGEFEVAVVYLRALYSPDDLKTERDWSTRLMIERSKAIKCPTVYYQLAGTKKVQQVLARPGVLEKWIKDPTVVQRLRATFAGQYSLDMGQEGDETVALALSNPDRYVLKPQREGGGNNHFGEEIRTILGQIGKNEERTAYVLMDRVHPVPHKNYPLISGHEVSTTPLDMVGEMGVFGIIIGTPDSESYNKQKGHILRTKTYGTDEGGINAGFAALDSPYFI